MADKEEKAIVPVNDLVIDDNLYDGKTHVGAYVTCEANGKSTSLVFEDIATFSDGKSAIYLTQPLSVDLSKIKKLIEKGGAESSEAKEILERDGVEFSLDALFLKLDSVADNENKGATLLLGFSCKSDKGIIKSLAGDGAEFLEGIFDVTAVGLRIIKCPNKDGKVALRKYVKALQEQS